ncbi:hypothetical protein KFK09_000094 [Dendrobium nobile]|uniref:Uncharacterized protein n=1 Tax=Dendrobium nobile TaxID=94219 RepID=A0A8T3CDQ8_DENNO|nr:hypothetical protein KFK09_000094 [Dendrobium nobile]
MTFKGESEYVTSPLCCVPRLCIHCVLGDVVRSNSPPKGPVVEFVSPARVAGTRDEDGRKNTTRKLTGIISLAFNLEYRSL